MLITKGKTEYRFAIQNVQEAEQKIQSWLSANSFQQMQEDNVTYYRGGDAMLGHRFFEYSIDGSQAIIYAYLGSFKKPRALADGIAGSMAIIPYKNALESLFASLNNGAAQAQQPATPAQAQAQQPATPAQAQAQQQNTYGEFKQAANKRNNTCAEVSFWVSILMLVVSFFGIIAGAVIVVFNYYLAVQGLKSDKKGKAIAAIAISSIAIVVMIVKLIIEYSK